MVTESGNDSEVSLFAKKAPSPIVVREFGKVRLLIACNENAQAPIVTSVLGNSTERVLSLLQALQKKASSPIAVTGK